VERKDGRTVNGLCGMSGGWAASEGATGGGAASRDVTGAIFTSRGATGGGDGSAMLQQRNGGERPTWKDKMAQR
jgi:hypothetical protein